MPSLNNYEQFLKQKNPRRKLLGFEPLWIPDFLFGFQKVLDEWAIKQGRCAIFADCGMGKTPMQLVWAENIIRKTGKKALIVTPLAVASQTIREAEKFGIQAKRSRDGQASRGITVTNYHKLHHFQPKDFACVVLDESSILKNFEGKYRKHISDFMAQVEYRLLCTATPAPNDFMELGTSSEALGFMSRNSMLGMFFTNDGEATQQWRLKGHAKKRFWQWVASWARAIRKPSDLGFDDGKFQLPPLEMVLHKVKSKVYDGFFPRLATTLAQQRQEKKRSTEDRCQRVAEVLPQDCPCLVWCQHNRESSYLADLIPEAVEVTGSDPDEVKEERLNAFALGQIRVLVSKPSIACFGLNYQHCADVSYFPSHSHEQFYQAVRRCWRFGQEKKVICNLVYSEAEAKVLSNMLRKEQASEELYRGIVRHMSEYQQEKKQELSENGQIEVPSWLVK